MAHYTLFKDGSTKDFKKKVEEVEEVTGSQPDFSFNFSFSNSLKCLSLT